MLPPLLEFVGGAVIVGHNIRFDISFLDAALVAPRLPQLEHRRVDTLGLARRLVRDEVPDLKLGTLARHLRVSVVALPPRVRRRAPRPPRCCTRCSSAPARSASSASTTCSRSRRSARTRRRASCASPARLPRRPGVYLMQDRGGRILYVGKATNLRARVRSYFGGDDRAEGPAAPARDRGDRLDRVRRRARGIGHASAALIPEHAPRFNRG